jgi:hypothetical protein
MNIGGSGVGMQEGRNMAQTVAQVENREPFTLAPGETKTVNLQLYINGGTSGLMGTLQNVTQSFGHINYIYSVHASARRFKPSRRLPHPCRRYPVCQGRFSRRTIKHKYLEYERD